MEKWLQDIHSHAWRHLVQRSSCSPWGHPSSLVTESPVSVFNLHGRGQEVHPLPSAETGCQWDMSWHVGTIRIGVSIPICAGRSSKKNTFTTWEIVTWVPTPKLCSKVLMTWGGGNPEWLVPGREELWEEFGVFFVKSNEASPKPVGFSHVCVTFHFVVHVLI